MAKNKNKKKSGKRNKKKKGKNDFTNIIADAVADLARKSTKKIIKSLEKKGENLFSILAPAVLKITNGKENAIKKEANSEEPAHNEDKTEVKSSKNESTVVS